MFMNSIWKTLLTLCGLGMLGGPLLARDNDQAIIRLERPPEGSSFALGQPIPLLARTVLNDGFISTVVFLADGKEIGVSTVNFIQAPPPGEPVWHEFVWTDASAGRHVLSAQAVLPDGQVVSSEPRRVQVGDSVPAPPRVTVVTTRPYALEGDRDNRGEVVFQRTGDLSESLTVSFLLGGEASRESDYRLLLDPCDDCLKPDVEITGNEVVIPAGQTEVRVGILASYDGFLDFVEPVVEDLIFWAVPVADPALAGTESSEAAVVSVVDRQYLDSSEVILISPADGTVLPVGRETTLEALAVDPAGSIRRVEFLANDEVIGVSEILTRDVDIPGRLRRHEITWKPSKPTGTGWELLTVRAKDAADREIQSRWIRVRITDEDPALLPTVTLAPGRTPASETGDQASRTATFILSRHGGGDLSQSLAVFAEVTGSALPGVDYRWILSATDLLPPPGTPPFMAFSIPAGETEVEVPLEALPDRLPEGTETVSLRLIDPPLLTALPNGLRPFASYRIGEPSQATVEILDSGATEPFALLVQPEEGAQLAAGSTASLVGLAGHPDRGVEALEFLAEGQVIGRVTYCCDVCDCAGPVPGRPFTATLEWPDVPEGNHILTVRALFTGGEQLTSPPVHAVATRPSASLVLVSPAEGNEFSLGDTILIDALGQDPDSVVSTVEFFANGVKIGENCFICVALGHFPPGTPLNNQILWKPTATGDYELTAVGQFGADRRLTSPPVHIRVRERTTGARIAIVQPQDGATVRAGRELQVVANATGRFGGITDVVLRVDGQPVAESHLVFIRPPEADEVVQHAFTIILGPGAHELVVQDLDDRSVVSRPIRVEAVPSGAEPFVTRRLPHGYEVGTPFTVRLEVSPPANVTAYVVEDRPPYALPAPGLPHQNSPFWPVTAISEGGAFDPLTGKVKFGPFYDSEPRVLTYDLTPHIAMDLAVFEGLASADGVSIRIGGDQVLTSIVRHPADRAPANDHLSADELSAYAAVWKTEESWPAGPSPVPLDYVTRAAFLWKSGEYYAFDAAQVPPLCWVPVVIVSDAAQGPSLVPLAGRAVRGREVQADGSVRVTIRLLPAPGTHAVAVEEVLPDGAVAGEISSGGIWTAASRTLRWGPFFAGEVPTLSYLLSGPGEPRGRASFDGQNLPLHAETAPPESGGRLVGIDALADGSHQLSLESAALLQGTEFELQVSTDLKTWQSLGTFTSTQAAAFARDVIAVNEGARFYRAVEKK